MLYFPEETDKKTFEIFFMINGSLRLCVFRSLKHLLKRGFFITNKLGLKRIYRVPGYPVPQSTRITRLPILGFDRTFWFCKKLDLNLTCPCYGPESRGTFSVFENIRRHCFISIKLRIIRLVSQMVRFCFMITTTVNEISGPD